MRLRYTDALVVLAAVAAGGGYWFWSKPPEPMGERRVAQVAISPSGKWYAAGSVSGRYAVWPQANPDSAQHFRVPNGTPRALAFSPDEKYLVIAHSSGLTVQTVQEMRVPRSLRSGVGFRSVTFPPRGRRALAVTNEGLAEWWDPESGEGAAHECCTAPEGVLAYIRDGDLIAASGAEPALWDAHSREHVGRLAGDGAPAGFGPVAFDTIRGWILMGSRDGRVYAWDAESKSLRAKSPEPAGSVESVAVLKDSPWIAFAKTSAPLHLWNPDTGEMRSLEALPYSNVVAGPQAGSVLFGNYAGSVELWNVETGAALTRFTLH